MAALGETPAILIEVNNFILFPYPRIGKARHRVRFI